MYIMGKSREHGTNGSRGACARATAGRRRGVHAQRQAEGLSANTARAGRRQGVLREPGRVGRSSYYPIARHQQELVVRSEGSLDDGGRLAADDAAVEPHVLAGLAALPLDADPAAIAVDVALRHVAAALLGGAERARDAARADLAGSCDGALAPGWEAFVADDGRTYYWNDESGEDAWTPPTRQLDSCLAYLRDRVGVPRDMGPAAARSLRAHLNWAIELME